MAPTKKSSSAKAPAKKPMVVKKSIPAAPKSQYEIERDERIKRNEEYMLSIGINPYGSGYLKEKKKAPPKPRLPKKKVPESERRRSSRLQGGTAEPERLTYDEWSDDEGPKRRSQSSRRMRVRVVDELSDEQRAVLEAAPTLAELEELLISLESLPESLSVAASVDRRTLVPGRNCLGG